MATRESNIWAIVLAAGKGTRMKSSRAKVLHEMYFSPMIYHVMDSLSNLSLKDIVVVCGHQGDQVEEALLPYKSTVVWQKKQLGTGHAVLAAKEYLKDKEGTALILCGDTPLILPVTLDAMIEEHTACGNSLTVMTTILSDPTNYGRIVKNDDGGVEKIVEEKDATDLERQIKEVNAGIYCVDLSFVFAALQKVGTNNSQGEVYLTDIVEIAHNSGRPVGRYVCEDSAEITGVNSRVELARAAEILQQRYNKQLMVNGITLVAPHTVFIEKTVTIGRDTIIHPNCYISGDTSIGQGCMIKPFVKLTDCCLGDNVTIESFTDLKGEKVVSF